MLDNRLAVFHAVLGALRGVTIEHVPAINQRLKQVWREAYDNRLPVLCRRLAGSITLGLR